MEAICSSEMSVATQQTTRRHIRENDTRHSSFPIFRWTGYEIKPLFSPSVELVQTIDTNSLQKSQKVVPGLNWALYYKDMWGSGGVAPCIFNFGTGWNWVVSFMSWLHYLWLKSSSNHWIARVGGHRSWSECKGEDKSLLPLLGIWPQFLGCPACSQVTIPTELSRFIGIFRSQEYIQQRRFSFQYLVVMVNSDDGENLK
jgi:hypothetical protein